MHLPNTFCQVYGDCFIFICNTEQNFWSDESNLTYSFMRYKHFLKSIFFCDLRFNYLEQARYYQLLLIYFI